VEFDGASGAALGSFLTAQPSAFTFAGSVLYTTDPSDTIITYDSFSGAVLNVLAGPTLLMNAGSIELDADGTIVVVNRIGGSVSLDRFSPSGGFIGTISSAAVNDFVFGPNGNIYATTAFDEVVEIRPSDGVLLDVLT
jgi:sugar lactone lactonase YvrE